MKKILIVVLMFFMMVGSAQAFRTDHVLVSGIKTADANAILTGAHYLYKILIMTDGTNDCTVVSYDALTATGTKIHPDYVAPTSGDIRKSEINFYPPLYLSTGLSIDITLGAGAVGYAVYYRKVD